MARNDCGVCSGRGTVECPMCDSRGYKTVGGEHITCSNCSGGRRDCLACEGTGRRTVTSAGAASLYENTTDDRKTSEKSPEALISSMRELRKDIRRGINQCSLLPPALRDDWQERLANLTDANCVAELEALRREVKDAYEKRTLFFDYRQVSKSTDLESDLSLLETELRSLRDQCSRYLSKLH